MGAREKDKNVPWERAAKEHKYMFGGGGQYLLPPPLLHTCVQTQVNNVVLLKLKKKNPTPHVPRLLTDQLVS